MNDLTPYLAGIPEPLGRSVAMSHREIISRAGHYRRTMAGALVYVEPHEVLAHIAEHGAEPPEPSKTAQSIWMGKEAMKVAELGHNIVHAMHRKGLGWIDFVQGIPDSLATASQKAFGILHIIEKHGATSLANLPEVIAKGREVKKEGNRITAEHDGWRVSFVHIPKAKDRAAEGWLVTGFEQQKGPAK
jgi:hypothetical protein